MAKLGNSKSSPKTILAVIDIGGNSTSCEFVDIKKPFKKPKGSEFKKIRHFPRLAQGVNHNTGLIDTKAQDRVINALLDIKERIKELKKDGHTVHVRAIGTAPFRNRETNLASEAGQAFVKSIKEKTEFDICIVGAEEEADLVFRGFRARYPNRKTGLIMDMGGGSTELILMQRGQCIDKISLPIGTLDILTAEDQRKIIEEALIPLPENFKKAKTLIYGGGTPRSISKSFAKVHDKKIAKRGDKITTDRVQSFLGHAFGMTMIDPNTLEDKMGVNQRRIALLSPAAMFLECLMEHLPEISRIAFNSASLRDAVRADMIEEIIAEQHKNLAKENKPEAA